MTYYYLDNNVVLDKISEKTIQESTNSKTYFEIDIPEEAKFDINESDWSKLKSVQKGHRFQRGEWEDYFVSGLKQSNKYCVFAFKDHYVNQSNVRNRNAKMQDGGRAITSKKTLSDDKKIFSATGYCVFEDCTIKFFLKMNDKLAVHVFYTGKLKHCNSEVNARHFRGKSRQELKDVLKNSTPTREYMNRICNSNLIGGNADYVGKSPSVYKKISAEAKDCYQSLIILRDNYIEKSLLKQIKGYIHLIQHIPGSIVLFNHEQASIFINNKSFYISQCDKNLISTTINSKNFKPFELCIKSNQLIPLTCMLTTESYSQDCISQWLSMFYRSVKTLAKTTFDNNLCFMTDFSINLVESVLEVFGFDSYETYCKKIFKQLMVEKTSFEDINQKIDYLDLKPRVYVNVCQNQLLAHLDRLLKKYYSFNNNYEFGMHAFSCVINSESLDELQTSLYSLMVILYNKKINSLVENSFQYLKNKLRLNEKRDGVFKYVSGRVYQNYICDETIFKSDQSLFFKMTEKIFEKCVMDSNSISDNGEKNNRQSHKLLYHFIHRFSGTIPLWSRVTFANKKMDVCLNDMYERFDYLESNFSNMESIDGFIKKYENLNQSKIFSEFEKFSFNNSKRCEKSLLELLVSKDCSSEKVEMLSSPDVGNKRVKSSKTELIKPKMNKKRKNSDKLPENLSYFNLVSLTDAEIEDEVDEEKEIVIERQHHIVSNEFGFDLTKEDLDLFETTNSINSNIIQFYLKFITRRECERAFVYPLSFYPNLKYGFNESFDSDDFNLFDYELVFVPIQKTDHWALAVVDFKKQKITYYDSQMMNDFDCLKHLT